VVEEYPRKPNLHGTRFELPWQDVVFRYDQLIFNWSEQSIPNGSSVDLFICGLPIDQYNNWGPLLEHIKHNLKPKISAFLDAGDSPSNTFIPPYPGGFDYLFKREVLKGEEGDLIPFNMLASLTPSPVIKDPFYQSRTFDFSYIVGPTHSNRVELVKRLEDYSARNGLNAYIRLSKDLLPLAEFQEITGNSRVAINSRGAGWDCYRYWELPAMGTVMLAEETPLSIQHDYVDGEECFRFRMDNLEERLSTVLSKSNQVLSSVAMKAAAKTALYHTPEARASRMLSQIIVC
jgi:hypothetical protein